MLSALVPYKAYTYLEDVCERRFASLVFREWYITMTNTSARSWNERRSSSSSSSRVVGIADLTDGTYSLAWSKGLEDADKLDRD
jgi:hypothetical protein